MRRHIAVFAAALAAVAPVAMIPSSAAQPSTFAPLVRNVLPSVVQISVTSGPVGSQAATYGGGQSLGSGFIIDSSGLVVTNNHVVRVGENIAVTLSDGDEYQAEKIGVDPETDLALLQIVADARFPAVRFGDSDDLLVGDWVLAIGHPFGLGGSVSAGIVSGKGRDIQNGIYDDFIQTDAAINQGNSGGPLFNINGEVVGVNTIIYSQSGGSDGIGFAVPGNLAASVVRQLQQFGETQRGFLGVLLEDVSRQDVERLNLVSDEGALVTGVPQISGPAGAAGIQAGDVIVRFDDKPIRQRRDLTRAVAETRIGSSVPVVLVRNGQRMTVRVTIARRETLTASNDQTIEMAGVTLQSANLETKALFGIPDLVDGVVVTHVDGASPLSGTLQVGDVILQVGWAPVNTPSAIEQTVEAYKTANSGPVALVVRRGDQEFDAYIAP